MTMLAPGLWLQRLTTREPSLDQLEVSIKALREVLELEGRLAAGRPTCGGDGVMATDRSANVVWQGDLLNGERHDRAAPSGAFGPLDVTWASRAEEPNGKTSPEELIASAWASCFAMALSRGLARAGTRPRSSRRPRRSRSNRARGSQRASLTVRARCPAWTSRPSRTRPRSQEGLPCLEGARRHP